MMSNRDRNGSRRRPVIEAYARFAQETRGVART
jgi:hypothetical protein